jgi:hypothetical protein
MNLLGGRRTLQVRQASIPIAERNDDNGRMNVTLILKLGRWCGPRMQGPSVPTPQPEFPPSAPPPTIRPPDPGPEVIPPKTNPGIDPARKDPQVVPPEEDPEIRPPEIDPPAPDPQPQR